MTEIPLSRGLVALIDDEDYDLVNTYRWFARPGGSTFYGIANLTQARNGNSHRNLTLHRLILGLPPRLPYVDHIDGNGLNNQKSNLRICTAAQNQYNRLLQKNNTSGFKGVSWFPASKKWRCRIGVGAKKRISLGLFDTPEEAYAAYCKASLVYHGEFSKTSY